MQLTETSEQYFQKTKCPVGRTEPAVPHYPKAKQCEHDILKINLSFSFANRLLPILSLSLSVHATCTFAVFLLTSPTSMPHIPISQHLFRRGLQVFGLIK
jgi:hypothetical protein